MITQFRVRNFKALRDVTLDLTPIHVLIGPNDSGKTSILQAIEALSRSVDYPLAQAFTGAWEGRDLVWRHLGVNVVLSAAVATETGQCRYEFDCDFSPSGNDVMVRNERLNAPPNVYVLTDHPSPTTFMKRYAGGRQQPPKLPEDAVPLVDCIYSAVRGVHAYRWTPSMLALPVAIDASRESHLEESGFGLAQLLDEIMNFDRSAFASLEEKFFSIFKQYDAIRLLVTSKAFGADDAGFSGAVRLRTAAGKKIVMRRTDGTEVAASQLSDGTLIVLAYLAVLYSPRPPSFLLIEEPENGIHPARLDDVIKILRGLVKEQGKTQVILTTHSSYVVDQFAPEEVTLCRMGDDGAVSVRRLSDSPIVQKQKDYFSLGEIWIGEGDEDLSKSTRDAPTS